MALTLSGLHCCYWWWVRLHRGTVLYHRLASSSTSQGTTGMPRV